MKNKILTLIEHACSNKNKLNDLKAIYELYDDLQYGEDIKDMANILHNWLVSNYDIDNFNFSLFNTQTNSSEVIIKHGENFFLDGELSFYFIINTHTEINAVVSFNAISKEQYDYIDKNRDLIDIAFFQISPILQNGIMKDHYIESSSIDSVTHVYNRQYLVEHIHKIIALSKKNEESITFLMIGIDRFKAIIDEFNYDVGDKVLIELAKVIHATIKDNDIVARLTGDEFLVALVNLSDPSDAVAVAQKLIDKFANTKIVVDEKTNQILQKTICIGIASYPQDSNDINQVLKYADTFLYEAKNKGRGKYAVYSKDDDSSIELF